MDDLPFEPPLRYSLPRDGVLNTVQEAIDYISHLPAEHLGHALVNAARERLYYAVDTRSRSDVEALEHALRELKIGGA